MAHSFVISPETKVKQEEKFGSAGFLFGDGYYYWKKVACRVFGLQRHFTVVVVASCMVKTLHATTGQGS